MILKAKWGGVIKEILDNIELTDELVARVSEKTYEFIKDYKGVE